MRNPKTSTLLLLLAGYFPCFAQDTPSPRLVLQQALDGFRNAARGQNRFTYHDIRNQTTLDAHGKRTGTTALDYDVTWLGETPYYKLIAENGRELTGHARDAEENRYLNAVATRTRLTPDAHGTPSERNGIPSLVDAAPTFSSVTLLRTESSPLGPVLVLHAVPPPASGPAEENTCSWSYTVWVAQSPLLLLHYRAEAAPGDSDACHESFAEEWYKQIDGLPYAYHYESHLAHARNGKVTSTIVSEDNMTGFRPFHATADDSAPVEAPPTDSEPSGTGSASPQ